MTKRLFTILLTLLILPLSLAAETFDQMWKRVEEAEKKDQPKTQMEIVGDIAAKAITEKAYGHLLKAEAMRLDLVARTWDADSLKAEIHRMTARMEDDESIADKTVREVVGAVRSAIIYQKGLQFLGRRWADSVSVDYKDRALNNADVLAAAKAADYRPFVVGETDADVFGDDMFVVVAKELETYDIMRRHYAAKGNRKAEVLSTMMMIKERNPSYSKDWRKSGIIASYDSLITACADLDVAGEVALERYMFLNNYTGATDMEKWDYLQMALKKWSGWKRIAEFRNKQKELTQSGFTIVADSTAWRPMQTVTVKLKNIRNVKKITVKICRADGSKVKTITRRYKGYEPYEKHADTIAIGQLPAGVYKMQISSSPKMETVAVDCHVSNVTYIAEALPGSKLRIVAVDATTGQPLAGAKVDVRQSTGNRTYKRGENQGKWTTLTCDGKGETIMSHGRTMPDSIRVYTATDDFAVAGRLNTYFGYNEFRGDNRIVCNTFTDRSIYRPGQTVKFGAIVYHSSNSARIVAGKALNVEVRDADNNVFFTKECTTNEFGVLSDSVQLPKVTKGGRFTVRVGGYFRSFRVEEYKRPTFELIMPEVKTVYKIGDTLRLKVKAMTYAGVAVQGAKVEWTVTRTPARWWRWTMSQYDTGGRAILCDSTAVTGDDGAFEAIIPLLMPKEAEYSRAMYDFALTAKVTDQAGETHEEALTVPLGVKPYYLSSDLAEKVLASDFKAIRFTLRNAMGKEVEAPVSVWLDGEKYAEASSASPLTMANALTSGKHNVMAVCKGDTLKQDFVLFSLDDSKPCVYSDEWFYASADAFPADGKPVTVQVGSSDEDVHVVYTIISGERVVESGAFDVSDSICRREYIYNTSYGDGILLTYAWVKNGRLHSWQTTISRPLPDRELKLLWTTFRDRLIPGQQEEWRLSIIGADGKPAKASLMATLYDKSLDQLNHHSWHLSVYPNISLPYTTWTGARTPRFYGSMSLPQEYAKVKAIEFAHFYKTEILYGSNVFNPLASRLDGRIGEFTMAKQAAPNLRVRGTGAAAAEYDAVMNETVVEGKADEAETAVPQLRENFDETAFFIPSLTTDDKGEVLIKFTLPESVTTWNFMALAHTKDMCIGTLKAEAVAKKDVMVMPNMPRFVRTGDNAIITARIANTADRDVEGRVVMTIIDDESEAVVYTGEQPFAVAEGKTASAAFRFSPDDRYPMLVCRIVASGNGFSDGEQHYLPVLSDMEQVTVTVPITQHGKGTKTIDIRKLFPKDAKNKDGKDNGRSLTVEYTNNPAWMMIDALPLIGEATAGDALSQSAMYYANAIAAHIVKSNPDVMDDADSRIAEFLNDYALDQRQHSALEQLDILQNVDGSWSWWNGMRGNRYVTVAVTEMLTRLNLMTGEQKDTKQMLEKAYTYLDNDLVRIVKDMQAAEKRGNKPAFPGMAALRTLYVSAIAKRSLSAEVQSAVDYLVALMKQDIHVQSIYAKAMSAIVLSRYDGAAALEWVKSIKEYSVYTEEMGRYFDTRRAEYSWCSYTIPTEVMAIEALRTVTPDDRQTIEEMQRWLLQEKRTQLWGNSINNTNAIYAFFKDNDGVPTDDAKANGASAAESKAARITIDGRKLAMSEPAAGKGYVKTTVDNPKGRTLRVQKTTGGTSWGAVYATFMQKAVEVETHGSGITVKREILSPSLKVGDRVKVRITIEAARDFDLVEVTDKRAACMEPVEQLGGYRRGYYYQPKDDATQYYFDKLRKGVHVIETEYYLDRPGTYHAGTVTAACSYAPEFRGTAKGETVVVE